MRHDSDYSSVAVIMVIVQRFDLSGKALYKKQLIINHINRLMTEADFNLEDTVYHLINNFIDLI